MQDIRRQVVIALRWLPLILIGALAAGAIAYSVTSDQPKVYEATAKLVVDPGPDPSAQDVAVAAGAAIRYADLARSSGVIDSAIELLGREESPQSVRNRDFDEHGR